MTCLLLARGRDRLETTLACVLAAIATDLLLARGRDRLETRAKNIAVNCDLSSLLLARGRDRLETFLA